MLTPGQQYIHEFSFTQAEVEAFAEVTGDRNPIHIDEEYAAKSIFKTRVIHGMLGSCVFSKVFGTLFPGEGTIYLKQSLSFLRPMYADQQYEAVFTVKEVFSDKNRAVIETEIREAGGGYATTKGEALTQNPRIV